MTDWFADLLACHTAEGVYHRRMAEEPIVCDTKPLALEVEAGTYYWCACGRSAKQPFCDGSHKGTGLQSMRFEVAAKTTVWWCQCKHTATPPLCDGAHKKFRTP
jgi:CDGSH-type Zn-finger protein